MSAEERARQFMERYGGEHPDLRPGFAVVTIEALTETILAAQRETIERCVSRVATLFPGRDFKHRQDRLIGDVPMEAVVDALRALEGP